MKQTDVSISLKSVREIRGASVVNRRAALRAAGKPVQVDMAVRVVPDIDLPKSVPPKSAQRLVRQ